MIKTFFTIASLSISTIFHAQKIDESKIQNQFQLSGDVVSFPINLVNAFPFISGEVNGVKGKFMFDTGHQGALDINNNLVPLSSQKESRGGQVGSGQKFKVYNNDIIEEVKLENGLHFINLKQIESGNYDFLQNDITPDCLGYIGFSFFKGYLFKLDYTKRKLTFYKNTAVRESSKDFLKGEKILAVLNFEIRKLPNHPIIKVRVNDVEIIASFDTGGYGGLEIVEKNADKLMKKKNLIRYGKDGYDDDMLILNKVKLNAELTTNFIGIYEYGEDSLNISHVKKALGITEDNYLTLGYRFLTQFKTVWDYENKKIYVLEY